MEGPQRRLKLEVKAETEVTPWQQSMQASPSQGSGLADVSTHRRSRWRQGGRRQDRPEGPTPVSRRDHLKGALSILEFANSDQEFHVMARCMEGLYGLKIDDLGLKKPKRAVDNFFERYTGKDAGHHREVISVVTCIIFAGRSYLCIAVLVTPSFYKKVFRGQASFDATRSFEQAVEDAEKSACRRFAQDPDVLEACSKLPPSLNKIRKLVYLSEDQKKALGYNPKIVQSEMVDKLLPFHLQWEYFYHGCSTQLSCSKTLNIASQHWKKN